MSVGLGRTNWKLHELKPDFNSKCSFLGYSRQIQTKITRCRIGHTRLTHSYLLTNEQPPFCISCNEPFTVKHFLITCTEFNYIRNRYFTGYQKDRNTPNDRNMSKSAKKHIRSAGILVIL